MSTVQKWLTLIVGLGAFSLVLSKPTQFATAAGAVQKLTAGSVTAITK